MKSLRHLFLVLVAGTIVSSCITEPDRLEWDAMNYTTSVGVTRSTSIAPDSIFTEDRILATFRSPQASFMTAGKVVVAGLSVPPRILPDGGVIYELGGPSVRLPLKFDGDYVSFEVEGASGIHAVRDSVPTPIPETDLLFPTVRDTVSRSRGFAIEWKGEGNSQVDVHLISIENSDHMRIFSNVSDNGVLTIPASTLASFPTGRLWILLYRTSATEGKQPTGQRYMLTVASTVNSLTTLTE